MLMISISFFLIFQNMSIKASDLYAKMQYNLAFDQDALYKKNMRLIERLGCAKNVFPDYKPTGHTIAPWDPTNAKDIQELKNFQDACLHILNNERKSVLIAPLMPSIKALGFLTVASGATAYSLKEDLKTLRMISPGLAVAAINSFAQVIQGSEALYNSIYFPENFIGDLENYFAVNKCFIPNVLWPKIISAFIQARQNLQERATEIDFLSFILAFNIYKPKPAMISKKICQLTMLSMN